MRKTRIFVIVSAILICILFTITFYFWITPKDKPELKIEFNKSPPWIIRLGQNLTLNITIKNDGKASAKNVAVNVTVSIDLKILESGKNQYIGNFPEIKAGEAKIFTLTIAPVSVIQPGDYPFILAVYAENAPQLTFTDKITVQLPT